MNVGIVPRAGEHVTRLIDRRRLLKKASMTAFGLVAAWSVKGIFADEALAITCTRTSSYCACHPPHSQYCLTYSTSYCNGSSCVTSAGCSKNYKYYPITQSDSCWCTLECCYNNGCTTGYYECCDCSCPNPPVPYGECGCRKFVATCSHSAPASSAAGSRRPTAFPAARR
jgi:hypothetical protein